MDNHVKKVTFFSEDRHVTGYFREPAGTPPFPAVLMFHGGVTDAEENTLKMVKSREADDFLAAGFLVFSSDWRTLQDSHDPSRLRRIDTLNAYNFLEGMSIVNSDQIVCYGHSAGAATALWAAIETDVKGTAEVAGILDYGKYAEYGAAAGKNFITDVLFPTLGDDFKNGGRYIDASPIYFVDKIKSPILVIHGGEDQVVPVEQAYLFEETLKKYNKDFQMFIIENGSHKVNNYKKYIAKMVEFFKKCLNKN